MAENVVDNAKRKRTNSTDSTDDDYTKKIAAIEEADDNPKNSPKPVQNDVINNPEELQIDLENPINDSPAQPEESQETNGTNEETDELVQHEVFNNPEELQLDLDEDVGETVADESSDCPDVAMENTINDSTEQPEEIEMNQQQQEEEAIIKNNLLFTINFSDTATFNELNSVLEQAIRTAMLPLKKTVTITAPSAIQLTVTENADQSSDCIFIIDATASSVKANHATSKDVPRYNLNRKVNVFNDQTQCLKADDDSTECKRPAKLNTCFNCDGEHSIRDCTEPKNFNKIRQNRSQFSSSKTERYHVDAEQRFGQFIPGQISKCLQKALGLSRSEIPTHVYRMRVLGYPPGWLEGAKVTESGLQLFGDSDTTKLDGGEIDAAAAAPVGSATYDLKKIINFPGFNVLPEENAFDVSFIYIYLFFLI